MVYGLNLAYGLSLKDMQESNSSIFFKDYKRGGGREGGVPEHDLQALKYLLYGIVESSFYTLGASLVAQTVKHLPAMWETEVQSLGSDTGVKTRLLPQIIIFTISPGVGDPLHLDSRPKLSRGF